MRAYILPLRVAIYFFPMVALMFTLPYMAMQYRKYGAILALRTAVVYSFILYLMCAYFLTILPLPSVEKVKGLTSPVIQLIPFFQLYEMIAHAGVKLLEPGTYWRLIWNRDFFQMAANVAMVVPFGIYLRYYFHRSAKQAFFLSLGLALVFEITQLTGLFFIYPRPYRLADVDDLICNTLGGMLGFFMEPLLTKVLPTKERMDSVAYRRGSYVSFTRRFVAAAVDGLLMGLVMIALAMLDRRLGRLLFGNGMAGRLAFYGVVYGVSTFLYFILGEWLWKGETLGKRLTRIRLTDVRTGSPPKLWQCLVRYGMLYWVIVPAPVLVLVSLTAKNLSTGGMIALYTVTVVYVLVFVLFWLLVVIHTFTHSIQLLHGKLSKTRNISTLVVTEDMLGVVGMEPDWEPALVETPPPDGDVLNE